jgi:hypothetical protein
VGASTPVSRQRAVRLVREQAEASLRGEPLRNVISGAHPTLSAGGPRAAAEPGNTAGKEVIAKAG